MRVDVPAFAVLIFYIRMLEFHISYLMVVDLSRYNRLKHIPYIFLSHWPRVCAGQTDTIQITKTVRQIHSQIHICPLVVLLPITADQSRRREHASGQCVLICTLSKVCSHVQLQNLTWNNTTGDVSLSAFCLLFLFDVYHFWALWLRSSIFVCLCCFWPQTPALL